MVKYVGKEKNLDLVQSYSANEDDYDSLISQQQINEFCNNCINMGILVRIQSSPQHITSVHVA